MSSSEVLLEYLEPGRDMLDQACGEGFSIGGVYRLGWSMTFVSCEFVDLWIFLMVPCSTHTALPGR